MIRLISIIISESKKFLCKNEIYFAQKNIIGEYYLGKIMINLSLTTI